MRGAPKPFEIGEYLVKLQNEWNTEVTGFGYTDFCKGLEIYPEFRATKWANLNYCRKFYRIYHDYEPRSEILAVELNYAASLSFLVRRGVRKPYFQPNDLCKDRKEALKRALAHETTAEALKNWIVKSGTHMTSHGKEGDIAAVLFSRNKELKRELNLELIGAGLNTAPFHPFGILDLVGLQGTSLIIIEVEVVAKAEDVGQLLGFVGEITMKQKNGNCTMYKAGRQIANTTAKSVPVECSSIIGWLVAEVFEKSAFYAAHGQRLIFWKVGSDYKLHTPLDMRMATELEFEEFQASRETL